MCGSSPSSISVDELRQLQERTSGVVAKSLDLEGGNLSYFEVFTALAFKHFKDRQVWLSRPLSSAHSTWSVSNDLQQLWQVSCCVCPTHRHTIETA